MTTHENFLSNSENACAPGAARADPPACAP